MAVERLLREPQVLEIIPVSKATLWRGVKSGQFPKPVRLSSRTVAWTESSIQSYIDKLKKEAAENDG